MARWRTVMTFKLPTEQAHAICLAATVKLGWSLACEGDRRIMAQEVPARAPAGVNLVRIAICFQSRADDTMEIVVNGANFGSGPVSAAHVRDRVDRLVFAIQRGAERATRARADGCPPPPHNVLVNGTRLADPLVTALEREYATGISDGAYWYDPVCGAWGVEGGPTCDFIQPDLDLGGPLRADASKGASGVLINGRELGKADLEALWRLVDVPPGRYWLNASGEFGYQPGPRIASLTTMPCSVPAARRPDLFGAAPGSPCLVVRPKVRRTTQALAPPCEEPIPL